MGILKSSILRVIAFAALFAYILPAAFRLSGFGSGFAFTGSIFSALGLGLAFVAATFVMLLAINICASPFKLSTKQRIKLAPVWGSIFFVVTVVCLLEAHSLLPAFGLTVTGWVPAIIGSGAALAVMHLTLPGIKRS